MAFRGVRSRHPFDIGTIVVLPDHPRCIGSLPAGDIDFVTHWRLIKTWFTKEPLNQSCAEHVFHANPDITTIV
ncbi:MAG: hypothetical protein H0U72_12200 [Nitrosospira sp.]|nr:hypothetical protein [Nitrosospira sp.]